MSGTSMTGTTAVVTAASRGFGRRIAGALIRAGAQVVGVARDQERLAEVGAELGAAFTSVSGDAADPEVAGRLVDRYRPGLLVLNAGATPLPRAIQRHTWETFGRFVSVLPQLTSATELGATFAAAYAARAGGPGAAPGPGTELTTEQVGAAIVSLAGDAGLEQPAYLLTAAGLRPAA